jgi:hypothetical protein
MIISYLSLSTKKMKLKRVLSIYAKKEMFDLLCKIKIMIFVIYFALCNSINYVALVIIFITNLQIQHPIFFACKVKVPDWKI